MTPLQIEELIKVFADAAKTQHMARNSNDWRTANKETKKMIKAFRKICDIGPSARDALLALTDEEDSYVALNAANFSLKHNPEKAIRALKRIAMQPGVIGFEAQMAIKHWEEGTWKIEPID